MLNEKSDVYSFGILIMEIITGRNPVDYSRAQGEVAFIYTLFSLYPFIMFLFVVGPEIEDNQIIAGEFG